MKTIVEKLDPTRAKLTITVSPDDLKPSITHAYQHIAEQVAIPASARARCRRPSSISASAAPRCSSTP